MRINQAGLTKNDVPEYGGENPTPMTLSVMMIVKNGATTIGRAIQSISSIADEIVVVDTGSTDNTIQELDKQGVRENPEGTRRLYHYEWTNNFSAARNYAKYRCKGHYILWLDDDDFIPLESAKLIRAALKNPGPRTMQQEVCFSFNLINVVNGKPEGEKVLQPRVYPNVPEIYWEGKIHETFTNTMLQQRLGNVVVPNIEVHHYGYDDEEIKKAKYARNLEYLCNSPDTPMTAYHHATTLMCQGKYDQAAQKYEETLKKWDQLDTMFVDHVRYQIALCRVEKGEYESAMELLYENQKKDCLFVIAECYRMLEKVDQAEDYYRLYLDEETINDPWGTKQRFYRFICYKRLLQIMDKNREEMRVRGATEYPEQVSWE